MAHRPDRAKEGPELLGRVAPAGVDLVEHGGAGLRRAGRFCFRIAQRAVALRERLCERGLESAPGSVESGQDRVFVRTPGRSRGGGPGVTVRNPSSPSER